MYPCACAGVPNFKFSRRVCTLPSCGRLSPSSVTISLIKAVSACGRTSGTSIGVGRAAYIVSTVSRLLQRLPTSQVNYFHLHLNLQVQPSRAPRPCTTRCTSRLAHDRDAEAGKDDHSIQNQGNGLLDLYNTGSKPLQLCMHCRQPTGARVSYLD